MVSSLIHMSSDAIEKDLTLLDSAARVFRERAKAGSRLQALMESAAPTATAFGVTAEASAPQRNETDAAPADTWDVNLLCTERLARSLEWNLPQIGDMPPEPPTIRGRMGAMLVRIVRRALFWYTSQIKTFHARAADAAREQALAFQGIGAEQRRQRSQIAELRNDLIELERQTQLDQASQKRLDELEQAQAALQEENRRQKESLTARIGQLGDALAAARETHSSFREEEQRHREAAAARWLQMEKAVDQYQQTHASYRERENLQRSEILGRLAQIDAALAATGKELNQNFKAEVKEIQQQVHAARTHVLQQDLRLKMLIGELRKRGVSPADAAAVLVGELAHNADPLFVDHAASFRGSRADIKKRLTVYLPYAQEAFAAAMKSPALDLGCGRGEWMELLTEAGIPAKGIDLNRELVSACRGMGFDVAADDISQFVQTLPDESRSIVTAFHVLEHIPFSAVVDLIDQAVRVLKPGGIAIFETPNPKNLFVSSNNFYLDPTHRNPIPSEFLAFLVESRGLCDPKVIPLSPYPDYFHLPESDCPAVRFINEHFFGPQDYGVVARKV
jgi:2-polyprenyl-3-methyl-5-hydroxy-6-metoxy-1,4-benzoquinol methylase